MNDKAQLRRSLTLFTVVCLGLNGVIGQGIFLLPGKAAEKMGPAALIGLLIGGLLCFCIALCFAEVGSRVKGTGGAYLYARKAFGEFVGFEVGWMTCCVAVIAWATLSNGFTEVFAEFVPTVGEGLTQKFVAVGVVTLLTLVNLMGADMGARVVKFFTIAKLVPIAVFIVVGLFYIEPSNFIPFAPKGYAPLAQTTMILLYAYVGFETMVVPAGEMSNPQRTVPLSLFIVIAISAVVYILLYVVATGTYAGLAGTKNPVALAAGEFMGRFGGTLILIGIALSVFGTNAGAALVSPRRFFALAERGDLPAVIGRVSPKTGAPVPAILLTWLLAVSLTVSGSFEQLLVLGVVARFAQYIPTTLAVLVLRRRSDYDPSAGYTIPGGPLVPLVTLCLCGWLLFNTDPVKLQMGAQALAVGAILYAIKKQRTRTKGTGSQDV
jgi:amino acid transporter